MPVALPGVWSEVRLTRGEFEQMIAPALIEPLRAFRRGVASAGISASDIHTVLLVGGSSRVPLVAETVAGELGRPVAVDTHPKHAVALGAARIVGTKAPAAKPVAAATPAVTVTPSTPADRLRPQSRSPLQCLWRLGPRRPAGPGERRRMAFAAVAAVAVIGAGAGRVRDARRFAGLGVGGRTPTARPSRRRWRRPEEHPEDHSAQDEPSIEPDPTVPTTEHAPPPDLCGSESGMCAFITDIRLDGDRYIVDYATAGFDPLIHGEDAGCERARSSRPLLLRHDRCGQRRDERATARIVGGVGSAARRR